MFLILRRADMSKKRWILNFIIIAAAAAVTVICFVAWMTSAIHPSSAYAILGAIGVIAAVLLTGINYNFSSYGRRFSKVYPDSKD